jgi:TRAP-type C4-dicarboxylate transport system permease small subunit
MKMVDALSHCFAKAMEWVTVLLMIILTLVVVAAVVARLSGASFSWYDEVAAIILAWITYYGSALAAVKRRHIGLDAVLLALPRRIRLGGVILAEVVVAGFFIILAWTGFRVLQVLVGSTLVSLTWVPVTFTQSVIPIGAALFLVGQLLSLPNYWAKTAAGISLEHEEIENEVEAELAKAKETHLC